MHAFGLTWTARESLSAILQPVKTLPFWREILAAQNAHTSFAFHGRLHSNVLLYENQLLTDVRGNLDSLRTLPSR